ncbi:hypothetical protein [Parasphingorhabdus sp.]|uniref:hypothetical protein n=1 Tax=Parasphingorhabdus sp. TaxID=2709688 RepID=UPI003296C6EC
MSDGAFWDNVLEQDESLLWVGRPKPRLHWRNWQLFGVPIACAVTLLGTGWFILSQLGTGSDIWLLVFVALAALVPVSTTRKQLKSYAATRYALTERRALFFHIDNDKTRVKSYPSAAMVPPQRRNTTPPCFGFLQAEGGKQRLVGFDYIDGSEQLLPHLARVA